MENQAQNRLNSQVQLVTPMLQKLMADDETQLEAGGMTFTPASAVLTTTLLKSKRSINGLNVKFMVI